MSRLGAAVQLDQADEAVRGEEHRADLVRYEKAKGSELVRMRDLKPFTIPIQRH